MIVKLKERMPFLFRDNHVWMEKGEQLEVIEQKEFPVIGTMYKLRHPTIKFMVFEGHTRKEVFEVTQ